LELLRETLDADTPVEIRKVPNPTAAHGLHALAEREEAGLIVVGSSHTGRAGRVLPGSTGERLLHGAPCPVAVAPKGYADRRGHESRVIGCGYDGSLSSQRALTAAHRIAAATGARLRVIRAFQPLVHDIPPGSVAIGGRSAYNDSLQKSASEELEAAVARIGGDAETFFAVGDPAQILADESEQLELLFVGSRGYGPLHAVVVGGVAGRLVREAACPVIVLPRKAGHVEEDSLFAEAASLHR
jgi:nucleotide-binding universal stress UspA family protein